MSGFIDKEYKLLKEYGYIDSKLYDEHNVKIGLRNKNGTGVLVGLTKVSDVYGYELIDDKKVSVDGHLFYRNVDLYDLAKCNDLGFEKTIFLLLFAHLPNEDELEEFSSHLKKEYALPSFFMEDVIMKNPSKNLMNNIQKSILSLYSYDFDPDNVDPLEMLKKGLSLIAKMPAIIAYSYQAKRHYLDGKSLHLRYVSSELSIAKQILRLIRKDGRFDEHRRTLVY